MEIVADLRARRDARPVAAIVGAFDSVHRGHQRLLGALVQAARARDAAATVVTFTPHPDVVLRGLSPLLLCDPAERDARFAALGVDLLVRYPFDRDVAATPAEAFVERLVDGGPAGRAADDPRLGLRQGPRAARCRPCRPLRHASGSTCSRSRRSCWVAPASPTPACATSWRAGRLATARTLLGRRFAVIGTVVHGDGRGRGLGYPTANLAFDQPVALPPDGIYAVRASWDGPDPLHPGTAPMASPRSACDPPSGSGRGCSRRTCSTSRPTFTGGASGWSSCDASAASAASPRRRPW